MTGLFDAWLMVDWSAANAPVTGRDSIWIAEAAAGEGGIDIRNIPTRGEAVRFLEDRFADHLAAGRRVLAGFDFSFGYPAGAAALFGAVDWRGVWAAIAAAVEDGADNRSNRFTLAAALNRAGDAAEGPFWGVPWQQDGDHEGLFATRPPFDAPYAEWRHAERRARNAHSVWKLCYNGAVGSQTLLGIARLERLRHHLGPTGRVWPYETAFADTLPEAPSVVLAEIFPSLFRVTVAEGEVRDAAQVRTVTDRLAAFDADGRLGRLLSAPACLDMFAHNDVLREEGWIMGLGHEEHLR